MRNIFITGLLLLCICALQGQPSPGSNVRVENLTVQLSDDNSLNVNMDLVLSGNLKVGSNQMVTFTPIVRGSDNQELLPAVYVYGRKRLILSDRNDLIPEDAERVFRHTNRQERVISYSASLPAQSWMDGAELILEQDICGCGNRSEDITYFALTGIDVPQPVVLPGILYRAPETEKVKRRVLKGQAYIDFPINEIVIYPDYMRNTIELAKIDSTLKGFSPGDIQSISLHGFASPEGVYKHNIYLAQGRTQALKDYIIRKFGIPGTIIATDYTPENWDGFIRLAESSQLPEKERILAIARKDIDPDLKEAELKRMPEAFRYMTRNWFPVLRHTNYEIEYILPGYTAEEARSMAGENPSRLSVREMFDAALLSGKGSDEYYRLIEAAVRTYPDNADANLNAAAAALERGDLEAAERYMEKADLSTPEAKNNMEYIKILKEKQ